MDRWIMRDERETGIDRAADRLSYLVLSFGVLAIVAVRGLARGEASWDLLGLVIVAGFAGTAYRLRRRATSRGWTLLMAASVAVALIVAAAIALVTGIRRA